MIHLLETAACLWEAVLELEQCEDNNNAARVAAWRELQGSATLRSTVVGWSELAEADWETAKDTFEEPFDWEFIPMWLHLNVDWPAANPSLKTTRTIPAQPSRGSVL